MFITLSGRCNGVGEKLDGGLRPRRPSGEDCREVLVIGLAVEDEGAPLPLGVVAVAGVKVTGTEVSIRCLGVDLAEGEDEDQLPLPLRVWELVEVVEDVMTGQFTRRRVVGWYGLGERMILCLSQSSEVFKGMRVNDEDASSTH